MPVPEEGRLRALIAQKEAQRGSPQYQRYQRYLEAYQRQIDTVGIAGRVPMSSGRASQMAALQTPQALSAALAGPIAGSRTWQKATGGPFALPGAGRGVEIGRVLMQEGRAAGRVPVETILRGSAAKQAATAAFAEAEQQFGGMMGALGREADPWAAFSALRAQVQGRGTLLYKKTAIGGILGLRLGGEDVWLPTQYGPYSLVPSGPGLKRVSALVTGTKDRLELNRQLALAISKQTDISTAHVRHIRKFIAGQIRRFRGSSRNEDRALMWAATGLQLDLLKANRGLDTGTQALITEAIKNNKIGPEQLNAIVAAVSSGATKLGYHPLFGKPEAVLKGIMPLVSDPTRLFPQFVSQGRPLHQDIAFAGLHPGDVSSWERRAFGRRLPRIRTREGAIVEKALSRGLETGFMADVGYLTPEHALYGKMALAPEQVILSRALAGKLRYTKEVGGKTYQVGVGTALKIQGKSMFVAALADETAMGGAHILTSASDIVTKNPDRHLQTLLQNAIYEAGTTGGHIRGVGEFSSKGIVGVTNPGDTIIFTPKPALAQAGMGTSVRRMSKLMSRVKGWLRGKQAINQALFEPAGGMVKAITEVGVRAMHMEPSFGGVKAAPLDFMMMALGGPRAHRNALRQMEHLVQQGSSGASSMFAFFSAFLGKNLLSTTKQNLGGTFRSVRPTGVSTQLIAGLKGIRTVGDLTQFLASGALPEHDLLLRFSREFKVPTPGTFARLEGDLTAVAGEHGIRRLALPSVRRLGQLLPKDLDLLDPFEREAAEKLELFLPKYARGVGRVLEAAAGWESAPSAATEELLRKAVYEGDESLLSLLASHSGKGKMLSRVLQPHFGRGVYTRIAHGWGELAPGIRGLPEVGLGEIAISESMARRLFRTEKGQVNKKLISRIMGGQEFFVGQQYWPALVPEAQAVKKLQIFRDREFTGRDVVSTNVYDRLAAFRDTDYDPTKIYLIRGPRQRELALQWAEHQKRLVQLKGTIEAHLGTKVGNTPPADIFAKLVGGDPVYIRNLLAQKSLAARHDTFTRNLQSVLLQNRQHLEKVYGGATVADAARAIGVAQQMAGIKKSMAGTVGEEIYDLLGSKNISQFGDITRVAETLATKLQKFGPDAAASDVYLGFGKEQYKSVASMLARSAQLLRDPKVREEARRAGLAAGRTKSPGELLKLLSMVEGQKMEGFRENWFSKLLRRVSKTTGPSGAIEAAALAGENAALKAEGAAVAAEGGLTSKLWAGMSLPWKIAIGAAGALVGLRVLRSTLGSDEPEPSPAYSRAAYSQRNSPLPPEPVGMPGGLHERLASPSMAIFSPPTARVVSPLQRSPRVTMTATAQQGMDFGGLGDGLALAALSPAGSPLAGVFTSGVSDPSRIDMNIEADLRSENRLYA